MHQTQDHDLVLQIYQTVSEPDLWESVLDRLAARVNARGCIVFEWRLGAEGRVLEAPFFTSGYERDLLYDYIRRFSRWENTDQDFYERKSLETDSVELVSERDLYPDDSAYLNQPHVREMLDYRIRHRYGGLLDKDNRFRARFAIQRDEEQGPFGEAERSTLKLFLPHLAKALDLGSQVSLGLLERQALASLFDKLTFGVCLVDQTGEILEKNALFGLHQELFRAFRVDTRGRLIMALPEHQRQFIRLLEDVNSHGHFGARPRKEAIVANAPDGSGTVCVEVVPLERLPEFASGRFQGALVISRDTFQPISVDVDLAKRAFQLTEAECGLIELLTQGLSNAQIADRRERSIETINSQVKAILGKSRAANRTQLVRLLCNFALPQTGVVAV